MADKVTQTERTHSHGVCYPSRTLSSHWPARYVRAGWGSPVRSWRAGGWQCHVAWGYLLAGQHSQPFSPLHLSAGCHQAFRYRVS